MTYEERLVTQYMCGWETYVEGRVTRGRAHVLYLPRMQNDPMPWATQNGTRFPSAKVIAVKPKAVCCPTCGTCDADAVISTHPDPQRLPWGACADCLIAALGEEFDAIEHYANNPDYH